MNKGELIRKVAENTGYTQKDTGVLIDAYWDAITEALKQGDKVQLAGHGTYELKVRKAGERINPQTKEKVQVPACKVPTFKFGKAYKNLFN